MWLHRACYGDAVSRRVAVAATLGGLLAAAPARAEDPRDTFGLGGNRTGRDTPRRDPAPVDPPPACDTSQAVGCVTATDPLDDSSPASLRTWLTGAYLLALPVGDARHDAVAHFAAGVGRDDSGVLVGGATGLESRWTIDGAPADNIRTGGVDTRIPLAFLEGITITAGGFSARDRVATGGTIDARLVRGTADHRVVAHAWGGVTTAAPRRPIAAGSYSVRRATSDRAPDASLALVATGPLLRFAGGTSWYAAGVAPSLEPATVTWRSARLDDRDGDGVPDGFPGAIATVTIERETITAYNHVVPALARVGWERGAHSVELTLVGHTQRDSVFLANATSETAVLRRVLTGDAIATWQGRWPHTRARAQLAWHRSDRSDDPRTAAASASQQLTAYVPAELAGNPALAAACTDSPDPTLDPAPTVPNCPVPFGFFGSGGAGLLVEQTADRPTVTADLAHAIGTHVVRVGGTLEDARLVTTSRYTGGAVVRSLFDGHTDTLRFYGASCGAAAGEPCDYESTQSLRYRTRYAAAYVEDTIAVAPNLQADLGVRWELMELGGALQLRDQVAPRLGLAWDFLGAGRSRAWATLGRSFVQVPAGVGQMLTARHRTVRDVSTPFGDSRVIDPGMTVPVAVDLEAAAQDEATAGVEVGQPGLAQVSAWVQGRTLRRGYETVSRDADLLTVHFDNPGRNGQAPAQRDTLVAAAELIVTPSAHSTVRASYAYTRARGNWSGPYDARQGANLFASTDFDVISTNQAGRLGTDGGHRAFVEAMAGGAVRGLDVGVTGRFTVGSGRPRSALADSDLGIIYLLPRGDAGRGPMISQIDLRLSARWRGTLLTVDLFNVFDRSGATNLDELYASGAVLPIAGGSTEDLVFLKTASGDRASRRTAFQLPTAYQPPFGMTLGLHRAF